MKKDITTGSSTQRDRWPSTSRSFLSPWFDHFTDQTRWMDDFFGRDMANFSNDARSMMPAIDVDETGNEFIVRADLPGVKQEDVSIDCTGNQLSISAERKYETPEGGKSGRRERFYGSYQRSFTLPTGVDADNIAASFEGGVLTLNIPKTEQIKARRIQIGESKKASLSGRAEKH